LSNWDPDLYLKFKAERTRSAHDLVSRITVENPRKIIDIGCGAGNSTQVLKERIHNAEVIGLDSSEAMIKKAKSKYPEDRWICSEASTYEYSGNYGVIFSNASLQWFPDQETLIDKLVSHLSVGGVLAVQVPANVESPLHQATVDVANEKWAEQINGKAEPLYYRDPDFFYEILSKHNLEIDLWVTSYIHILESHDEIIEWYRSTGMKPFLNALPDQSAQERFMKDVYI